MALKVQQYDVSEYKIIIQDGGRFTFDTGSGNTGTLVINGNLDVQGETTTVGSTDLVVTDNTITLNDGETGSGVSLNTAGMIIDRGTAENAEFFFDERLTSIDTAGNDSTPGSWIMQDATGTLVGLTVGSIKAKDGENLYLLGENGTGYLSVTGTTDYEKQVFPYTGSKITPDSNNDDGLSDPVDDDIIPNIKSVKDYVREYSTYNFQDKITGYISTSDTFVKAYDADDPAEAISKVDIVIDNNTSATFRQTNVDLFDLRIEANKLFTTTEDGDILIEADGTGSIKTSFPVEMEKITDPAAPTDGIKLYAKDEADGGTGLFFINENSTNDEIISRNKALLYSIIF